MNKMKMMTLLLASLILAACGEREKYEQHRHTYPVVEAAFHAEPLANVSRNGLIGHHRCAKRGIRWRQHRRQNGELEHAQPIEQQQAGAEPEQNGQRQADQQQPLRNADAASQHPQIRVGRVGGQHQRQGELGERPQALRFYVQVQQTQAERSEQQAERRKQDRSADRRTRDASGSDAVEENEYREYCKQLVHSPTVSLAT